MYFFIFTQKSFVKPLKETVYSLVEFQMRLGCRPPPKFFCSYAPGTEGFRGTSAIETSAIVFIFPILVKSIEVCIAFTILRLIWNQTILQ